MRTCLPRLLMVLLWIFLSISSLTGWRHLVDLKPDDPPIWRIFDLPSLITGGLPVFALLAISLAIIYILIISGHKAESLKNIAFWVLVLGLSAIFAYPIGSPDLFGNAAYVRLHAHYGLNPYISTLTDIPNYLSDPFLKNMIYTDLGTPYGPLWTWISYGLYKILAGFGLIPLFFGFKLIGLLSHILITCTVFHIADTINPGNGSRAAVIYGTNPLAIFDLIVNAHNDGPAILLLVASLYFMIRGYRYIWPFIAGVAASFKLIPFITFPFLFWKVLTAKNKGTAILNIISTVFVLIFFYYPFLAGDNLLSGFKTTTYGSMSNSLPLLLQGIGLPVIFYKFSFIVFILLYAYFLLKAPHINWNELLASIGAGFIIYYLLGALVMNQWYFLWPLALLSPVRNNIWNTIIIYETIFLLLSYIFKVAFWGKSLMFGYCTYLMGLLPVLIIFFIWYHKRSINP